MKQMPVYGTAFLGQMVQGIPDTTRSSNQVEKCSAQPAPWRHSDPERGPHLCLSMAYGQGAPDIPRTRRISQGCKGDDGHIHPEATCHQALPSPQRIHSSRHTPGAGSMSSKEPAQSPPAAEQQATQLAH